MYRVSTELQKHEWKFGRTRNAVGTRVAGKCFHSFLGFSQTSLVHGFYELIETKRICFLSCISSRKHRNDKKGNLLTLIIEMLIPFAHATITSTARAISVSPSSYRNTIFNQSAPIFSQGCFLEKKKENGLCAASWIHDAVESKFGNQNLQKTQIQADCEDNMRDSDAACKF